MLLSRVHYYKAVLPFALVFVVFYFFFTNSFVVVVHNRNLIEKTNQFNNGVKKIVAYSLRKQIELESVKHFCENVKIDVNLTSFKNLKQEGFSWENIEETGIYITYATLDTRLHPYHYVRFVGVIRGFTDQSLYCQIFSNEDGSFYVVKPTITKIWYDKWDVNDPYTYYQPILISCRVPEVYGTFNISLSKLPCEPNLKNLFKIQKTKRSLSANRQFTICLKPLNFTEDIGNHLIQWIEINKILGAEKFEIYVTNVQDNVRKILNWYTTTYPNRFKVRHFKPIYVENNQDNDSPYYKNVSFYEIWQRRRYEILTYNDCFYRNLDSKFVIPLDIDELIVPKTTENWNDLLQKYSKHFSKYSSLTVQNYYFFEQSTRESDIFFLQNTLKTKNGNPKGANSKSFILTNNTLTIFNHYALNSLKEDISRCYFIPSKIVQLFHYKNSCETVILPECPLYMSSQKVVDRIMYRYKDVFIENYYKILGMINGFYKV